MTTRLPDTIADLTKKDEQHDGRWVRKIRTYLLWFEYLSLSPSYELARKVRAGKVVDEGALPADFDHVLSVFDDLGDVQKALFRLWWKDVGLKHFGYHGEPPSVTRVGYARHVVEGAPDLAGALAEYFEDGWVDQGRQGTLLLAIPAGMPETKILKQVKEQLSRLKPASRRLIEPEAKYPLVGKRIHEAVLMRYLRTIFLRSAMIKRTLWQVGAQAEISPTYAPIQYTEMPEGEVPDRYDREMLTIITSRALLRGRMIAENAARGRFPSHESHPHALEFNYRELRGRIHRRNKWQRKEVQRLIREHDQSTTY